MFSNVAQVEILLDMLAQKTAETSLQDSEIDRLRQMVSSPVWSYLRNFCMAFQQTGSFTYMTLTLLILADDAATGVPDDLGKRPKETICQQRLSYLQF